MGLKSDSISRGGYAFGAGIIFASFQQLGTLPSPTDVLKMAHTGSDSDEQVKQEPVGQPIWSWCNKNNMLYK